MKKSTERKRIERIRKDVSRLFMNGLITGAALVNIKKQLRAAENKLK